MSSSSGSTSVSTGETSSSTDSSSASSAGSSSAGTDYFDFGGGFSATGSSIGSSNSSYSTHDKSNFDAAYGGDPSSTDSPDDGNADNASIFSPQAYSASLNTSAETDAEAIYNPAFDYGTEMWSSQSPHDLDGTAMSDEGLVSTALRNNETFTVDPSNLSPTQREEYAQLLQQEQQLAKTADALNLARHEGVPSFRKGNEWAWAQAEAEVARSKREEFETEHGLIDHDAADREALHTALDIAGMAPVVGTVADLLNAGIYVSEFDLANAAISAGALIPGGQVITGARLADKVVDVVGSIDGTVEASIRLADGATVHVVKRVDGTAVNLVERADGSVVFTNVEKVNGRYPINSGYAGRTHPSGIQFKENGYPDFSPYSKETVEMPNLTGNRKVDERLANQKAGFAETPEGYTWHHVEDAKTMQLVPSDIHKAARHTGGDAIIKSSGE